jgi:hypothetical protein
MSDWRKPRVKWKRAPDFAEIAEALGVATTQIMAVQNPLGADLLVLYTPDPDEETRVFAARVRRGVDGVLFRAVEDVELPGMWEKIQTDIEEHMREEFGDPPGE